MNDKVTVVVDKAKETRRISRKLFGRLGHKVECPRKGKGVGYKRHDKHRQDY